MDAFYKYNAAMLSYLYQYAIGGLVFAAGIAIAWRTGQVGLASGRPRRRLAVLIAGLAFFALLQGLLLLASR
jgi:hypothetical protein